MFIEIRTQTARDLVSQSKPGGHLLPPKIQVAVLQSQILLDVFAVMKWGGLRRIQDLEFNRQQLNFAAWQVRVHGAFRTRPDPAPNSQYEFTADFFGKRKQLWGIGVTDHLQQPFAITQVDENNATMIALSVHPASDGDVFAYQGSIDLTTIICTHDS